MNLTHHTVGDVLVIELQMDKLDATTGKDFRTEVEPLLVEGSQVVFDLHRVNFVDSSGLGAILGCLKHLVSVGGDLKLCDLKPRNQTMFERARISQVAEIHPTQDDAVSSYA